MYKNNIIIRDRNSMWISHGRARKHVLLIWENFWYLERKKLDFVLKIQWSPSYIHGYNYGHYFRIVLVWTDSANIFKFTFPINIFLFNLRIFRTNVSNPCSPHLMSSFNEFDYCLVVVYELVDCWVSVHSFRPFTVHIDR